MSHDRATTDNPLIRRLEAGQTALCMAIRISRLPRIVHLARAAGFDAIYVDMEHSTIALETTSELCLASWSIGLPALVRVPTHDPSLISRVLEGGAAGIIAPHVDTAAQALAVVNAARFRPLGHRAMAGAGVAIGYAPIAAAEAEELLGNRTIVVAMVESAAAIANADAIAAVRGVDMLLVGTGDLTEELGIPGKHDHPKVLEAYERVAASCRNNGKWLGIAGIKGESPLLPTLHRLGARFLSTRNDEALLLKAAQDETRTLRQLFAG